MLPLRALLPSAVALAALSVAGCGYLPFHEQIDPPPEGSGHVVAAPDGSPCLKVYLYEPGPAERVAILGALREVCAVRRDPAFAARVRAESHWTAGCATDRTGHQGPESIDAGEVVTRLVDAAIPDVHVLVYSSFGPRTNAATLARRRVIAIDPARVALWDSPDRATRSLLVDTLAHELSHLVLNADHSGSAFRDDADCRRIAEAGDLVSYRIGYLTGCWYEQSHPAQGETFSLDDCLSRGRGRY